MTARGARDAAVDPARTAADHAAPDASASEQADRDSTPAIAAAHVAELRARLETRLAGATGASADERLVLRAEIASLIRTADAALEAWRSVGGAARALPELWKRLPPSSEATSARPDATRRMSTSGEPSRGTSVRSDHLGASTFVAKGWTAYAAGDFAAADAAFERALSLAPDEPETVAMLAWARASLGQADDALLAAQRVLVGGAVGPAASLARVAVGRVCLEKGIEGEAIDHLARVIRDNDDRRATLYATLYLGMAYDRRGMHDDAVVVLRRALALGPNLVEARHALGCTLWRAGAEADACVEWRAGATGMFGPWARACAERLTEAESGVEVRA